MLAVNECPSQSQKYCVSGLQRSVRWMHVHGSPQPAPPAQTSPRPQSRELRHWPGASGGSGAVGVVAPALVAVLAVVEEVDEVDEVDEVEDVGGARVTVGGGGTLEVGGAWVSATATSSSQLPRRA